MLPLDLTDVNSIQHLLKKHDASPKRSMGQNFLVSQEAVEAITLLANEGPHTVTELGPGIGVVTQALIQQAFTVKAIEKDDVFANMLRDRKYQNFELIHDDLKHASWEWDTPYQIIGNIPYNLSGYIIRRITELNPAPHAAILMVQLEVAKRLSASVPDMNLLALGAQLWGTVEFALHVPKSCFWPQPEVDSAIVRIRAAEDGPPSHTIQTIMDFARPIFQQKRKQIGGTLGKIMEDKERAMELLANVNIPPTARPQEVTPQQWQKLTAAAS